MFEGLDQFRHLLQSGDYLFQQMAGLWNQGPKVSVQEQGNSVKVIIEAPGLMSARNSHQWAVRVQDQNLFLRGQLELEQTGRSDVGKYYSERRSEQFIKVIPLPAPVQRKPKSVRYEDGLITIMLEKHNGPVDDGWHALDFRKKTAAE